MRVQPDELRGSPISAASEQIIDGAPAFLALHNRDDGLAAQELANEVSIEQSLPFLQRQLCGETLPGWIHSPTMSPVCRMLAAPAPRDHATNGTVVSSSATLASLAARDDQFGSRKFAWQGGGGYEGRNGADLRLG